MEYNVNTRSEHVVSFGECPELGDLTAVLSDLDCTLRVESLSFDRESHVLSVVLADS